jgi:hypothetical protein
MLSDHRYDCIWLNGAQGLLQEKKIFKARHNTRLKLLRRTLRANENLAEHVRELQVPEFQVISNSPQELELYLDAVASLVMCCPNLERLVGLYSTYTHDFSRIFQALSTRKNLKTHSWIIGPSFTQQQILKRSESPTSPPLTPLRLHPAQVDNFLLFHQNWDYLNTLLLHSTAAYTDIQPSAIIPHLPSLQHLHISCFTNFTASDLLSLPPLKSLTLSSLPCVDSDSISRYSALQSAVTLESLSLIDLSLTYLPVISRLFAHLVHLRRFTLRQLHHLILPSNDTIVLQPYLASSTLEFLHWEILLPLPNTLAATEKTAPEILASSIKINGFPSLRRIRVPVDEGGVIQAVCKPRATTLLPADGYKCFTPRSARKPNVHSRLGSSCSLDGALIDTDAKPSSYTRSLRAARLEAQERIESAREAPKFEILVEDFSGPLLFRSQISSLTSPLEDTEIIPPSKRRGNFRSRTKVGGYIGTVGSLIEYHLEPDVEGSDEALASIADLDILEPVCPSDGKSRPGLPRGRRIFGRRGSSVEVLRRDDLRTCSGDWNWENLNGKKWWVHAERSREPALDLKKLLF